MASIGLGFTLSANAQGMSSGINAGVVELQKLGYAAKKTQADVSTLKTIELSRVFLSSVQTVAGAFNSFVAGSASAVASVDDLSKRTGVSTQTLQAYQFAAEQSGVSVETFGKGVQKLGINLGEAQTGNKGAIKSFADLGLSVQELSRLSPEAAFEAVAAAISQLPGPAQQAAAAVSLFGKSGAELVPVFAEGAGYLSEMRAEAERLGLVLSKDQVQGLATLDDSIGKVSATFKAFQARVTAELAPSLIAAAESAATFIASLDVQEVAKSAEAAIGGVVAVARAAADAFLILFKATAPLASTIFPVIANTLGLIASNMTGAAVGAIAAAAGFGAYSVSCIGATAATALLTSAITALLSRTGIGAIVVVLGTVGGAFASYAVAGTSGANEVTAALAKNEATAKNVEERFNKAKEAARAFATEAEAAFKLPAEITDATLIQGTIEEATSGFKKIAQEAGKLGAVPREVADAFEVLKARVGSLTDEFKGSGFSQEAIAEAAQNVVREVNKITDARKAEEEATKRVADTSAKATEEARKRVQELVQSGVPESEKSRLTLSQDLLAINKTIGDSEKNLADARKAGDAVAIQQAQERLRLTQETAAAATDAARQQARDRELSSLGLDKALLKPVETVKDQFIKVRQAFDKGLVNGGEARTALQNLAAEGISIRKEIAAELARPSQQALQVNDIRTQEGASQFLALATGRQDPALEQRRAQLAKLEEIKQAIKATGANPVEILGA
jgi:broad-specificity NMP kinase